MKPIHLALLAALPLAACNSNPVDPFAATVPQPIPADPHASAQDQTFATLAAQSDQFEIQSSQLALQKSRRPAIRAYAQRMIDEHTRTSQQLAALAQRKGMALPTPDAPDPVLQQKLSVLQSANRTFDREYLSNQVSGHRATADVMRTEIGSGQDAEVKQLAQTTLPMVEDHLQAAQRLSRR